MMEIIHSNGMCHLDNQTHDKHGCANFKPHAAQPNRHVDATAAAILRTDCLYARMAVAACSFVLQPDLPSFCSAVATSPDFRNQPAEGCAGKDAKYGPQKDALWFRS